MALVYLAISFLASLAVSVSVYEAFGSLILGIAAYGATGAAILFCVLLAALLHDRAEVTEPGLFAAE